MGSCSEPGQLGEDIDNARRQMRKLMDRFHNRLFGEVKSLGDKYADGEINFLARLGIESPDALYVGIENVIGESAAGFHSQQAPMLICDVEIVDGPKRVVPSGIRFYLLDERDNISSGSVYISTSNHVLKRLPVLAEREIDFFSLCTRLGHHFDGEQIQRGAKVMDSVTRDQTQGRLPPMQISDHLGFDQEAFSRLLGIIFEKHGKGLLFDESLNFGIKVADVMVGPADL